MAIVLGVPANTVNLTVTAASVNLNFVVQAADADAASAIQSRVTSTMSTTAAASALLGATLYWLRGCPAHAPWP